MVKDAEHELPYAQIHVELTDSHQSHHPWLVVPLFLPPLPSIHNPGLRPQICKGTRLR